MTSINKHAVYIEVPPLPWPSDAPIGGRATPSGGGAIATSPHAPGGAGGLGGGASLVQYKSITSTQHTQPSTIAKAALDKLNSLPPTDNRHKYDDLCFNFCEYLDQCEQKGFIVKGYDTKKGKILNLPMSYNNRWGPIRRMQLSEKLKRLEFWFEMQEDRPVTMATLTSYHPDDETVATSWQKLNTSRIKFLKMIKKYCGDVDYFWVPEPHPSSDSGYVHYHVAIFAEIPIPLENKLRNLWSEKYGTGSHTYGLDFSKNRNKEEKIRHLKNYLSKYLEKGFLIKEWSIGLLIFNATLWETGFRMYGASRRIREMMNIKDDKPNQIVWLETKLTTTETIKAEVEVVDRSVWPYKREIKEVNTEIPVEKVIWYRQYIPDWLDNPFWLDDITGKVCITDPPSIYFCDWGRRTKPNEIKQEPTPGTLTSRQLRKMQTD